MSSLFWLGWLVHNPPGSASSLLHPPRWTVSHSLYIVVVNPNWGLHTCEARYPLRHLSSLHFNFFCCYLYFFEAEYYARIQIRKNNNEIRNVEIPIPWCFGDQYSDGQVWTTSKAPKFCVWRAGISDVLGPIYFFKKKKFALKSLGIITETFFL